MSDFSPKILLISLFISSIAAFHWLISVKKSSYNKENVKDEMTLLNSLKEKYGSQDELLSLSHELNLPVQPLVNKISRRSKAGDVIVIGIAGNNYILHHN